jgi:ketosteroid isomerase-like protein
MREPHNPARVLLLGLFLLAAGAAQAQQTPQQVVAAFHGAMAKGDTQTMLNLLGPDVVIFEAGGAEMNRDEYRTHHLGADVAFARTTERKVVDSQAKTAGDAAWVLTRTTSAGTFQGKPVDSRGVETMVLRKTTQGWRIVHIHWSSARN